MGWCYDIASVVFGSAMDRVAFSVSLALYRIVMNTLLISWCIEYLVVDLGSSRAFERSDSLPNIKDSCYPEISNTLDKI